MVVAGTPKSPSIEKRMRNQVVAPRTDAGCGLLAEPFSKHILFSKKLVPVVGVLVAETDIDEAASTTISFPLPSGNPLVSTSSLTPALLNGGERCDDREGWG